MGKSNIQLSVAEIERNIASIQGYMKENNLDLYHVSSFDEYLNEYVPMSNCLRYYVTGFSGSVAEALVPVSGRAKVYVDGRYYEQADLEVDPKIVEVVKVPGNISLFQNLIQDLGDDQKTKLAYNSNRTSLKMSQKLSELVTTVPLNGVFESLIELKKDDKKLKIFDVDSSVSSSSTVEKINRIFNSSDLDAYFVTALDSIAWITNCLGYHLPFQSAFQAKALVTKEKVYCLIDQEIEVNSKNDFVEFVKISGSDYAAKLPKVNKVAYDASAISKSDFDQISSSFSQLSDSPGGLISFHCLKEKSEIKNMEENFKRGDQAIFKTIKWFKQKVESGEEATELDLYNRTSEEYAKQGAVSQSFNTIAGVGANGSIIHYGGSEEKVIAKGTDMILLDSGGYFEDGFATDTTRTFMGSDTAEVDPKMKEIYTLTLKGTLQCQHAVFPPGTKGCVLDGLARASMRQFGYDYNHGTGHGVGVNVHEGGVRLSPLSVVPMKEGQVCSIEPGIYIPGFGGVRIENIAIVEKHPDFEGMLRFRPLVYIGYEKQLIDESLLTSEEKNWLIDYHKECEKRGTLFS